MKYIARTTRYILTIFIFSFFPLLPVQLVNAADNIINSISNNVPVIDDRAGLFSDYEEVAFLDKAKQQRDRTGFQYIIITTNELERNSPTDELEYVYNAYRDNISADGTILFLIYNNNGSYECELQGYTKARDYIPHDMCDNIESRLNGLNADDMPDRLFAYLSEVSDGSYTYAEVTEDSSSLHITFIILIIILCIVLIGIIVICIMPRRSVTSDIVLPEPEVHIIEKKDTYIRTHESVYKL